MKTIIYLLILTTYIPGVIFILRNNLFIKRLLPSVYFLSMFIFNALGSAVVIWPSLHPFRYLDLFSIEYALMLIIQPLFFYLLYFVLYRSNSNKNIDKKVRIIGISKYLPICLWTISILLVAMYIKSYGMPPMFQLSNFGLKSSNLIAIRTQATVSVRRFYLYEMGFYTLPQLATISIYLRNRSKITFIISLIVSVLLSLAFMQKIPIVIYIVSFTIALILLKFRIDKKLLLKISIVVGVAIIILYSFYSGFQSADYIKSVMIPSIINRLVGEYSRGLAATVHAVDNFGFYYGKTLSNPGSILPYDAVNLSGIIHYILNPGLAGNAPSPAIGEGYVNFGWPGVIIWLFTINYFIFALQLFLDKIKFNAGYHIIMSVYLAIQAYSVTITSLGNSFLSPIKIVIFFILILFFKSFRVSYGLKKSIMRGGDRL